MAVSQLDQVTQQNAALVEESAAAADSLNQQAEKLVAAVSAFKLPRDAQAVQLIERAKAPRPAKTKAAQTTARAPSESKHAQAAEWEAFS